MGLVEAAEHEIEKGIRLRQLKNWTVRIGNELRELLEK
jgi:hypothetical protein